MEVYSFYAFIVGACIGSFLNVLILRLPQELDVIFLKSHCPACKKNLQWYHNIPLFSSVFLGFKCAYCKAAISKQYFVVELLTALLSYALFEKLGLSWHLLFALCLFYTLLVLAFIDLKYKAVPDYLLLIAFVLVFVVQKDQFFMALQGALLFAGAFALLEFVVTFYIQNIKARILKDEALRQARSLGEGDIPIAAIIGALLGIGGGMFAIFLAAFFAIIPSLYNSLKKQEAQTPFIPYLLLGLCVEYLFEISKVFI